MPKKIENLCPECGEVATEPYKTWELVAPFPDKKMQITVTVFGCLNVPHVARISED